MAGHVYVVAAGEYGEGQFPLHATSTLDGALDWVEAQYRRRPEPAGQAQWMARLDGCDEVWVYRLAVSR